ncbi:MAG TPA: GH116 family glycosyl hydrolase [Acidimicrobiales bacterium]|nr:GH116 family glycosyl hydrolase [Acidimicrobiales bacterium]
MRLSRRQLLAVASAALSAAAAGTVLSTWEESGEQTPGLLSEGQALWDIPDAAWRRLLGSYPPGATGALPSFGSDLPPTSRTKRGVPVGGIGTGSFMLNLCGSFGPWHMDIGGDDSDGSRWGSLLNSGFEQRFLPGAAFHVRISTPHATTVRTLATEDTLSAWNPMSPGDGVYSALFPKAWFEFENLPLPVALKQVTPFVARDEQRSSLPAGIFELAVDNPTADHVDISCMFSFPNAPYRMPTTQYAYTRTGLTSHSMRGSGTVGVRLQAQDPANVAETELTEWVIAAKGPSGSSLSTTEDWAADGDGSDLMSAFSRAGRLPDAPLDARRRGLAGAVAVSFSLAPMERKAATFVLAWDFPVVQFRNPVDGTRWWKRYTQWYPGPYRGWQIASDVLAGSADIESGIDAWWRRVTDNPDYPLWLRCAVLNELYYDVFGGVFWENGCITKPKRFGARSGQHLYFTLETDGYRDCESLDVRHYETRHLLQLFPTIERDVLLGWGDMVRSDPMHRTPHDAGSPVDDPWFVVNQYAATRRGERPLEVDWLDLPAKLVQQAHAYWTYTGDDDFASTIYPDLERAMDHLLSKDADRDGIPDADGYCTTYDDIVMSGATTYVAALTVGACDAMAELARSFDTAEAVQRWESAASTARASAESLLWSERDGYYALDNRGPLGHAIMADALCGQRYAAAHGLSDVLEPTRMARHLALVYERNVAAFSSGRFGAVNAVDPSGAPLSSIQARAVWPGGSYFTAALMYSVGKATDRADLVDDALDTAFGVYRTTYSDDDSAFWFDTPAQWLPDTLPLRYRAAQYQRSRGAWELMVAIHDPFPAGWSP